MSHNPKMSGGVGYIGSKISLISRSDIRYVGILHSINSADSTVALEQVRSYGTEGRKGNPAEEIPQSDNVFEYIVFRGSDVKDLHVCEAPAQQATMPPQVPNDPAILGTTAPVRPQYQQFAPPPLGVQPPPNFPAAPLNPFYLQQAAAAAFQQQHQQSPAYWPPHPQPPQINLADNVSKEAEQPKPQQQKEHSGPEKPEDHKLDGTALSNKNILSKPGPNIRQNIGHPVSIRNEVVKDVASSVAVEKLAKKVSELSVQPKEANGDVQPSSNYERPSHNNNNSSTSRNNNDNRPSSNSRLPGMGGHLVQVNRRRMGRRSYSQSYDRNRIPVPASDFDFESSNAKFNKDELVKEVVKKIHPNHESKEEETVEAHTTEEDEEEEDASSEAFYDRSKSFFDNISCETKERLEQQGPDGRRGLSVAERRQKQSEERRLNLETFGQVSIDGGRYRGRGYRGYRGSRGGYRGSYSSNYRGGSAYRGSRGGGSGVGNYRSNQNS